MVIYHGALEGRTRMGAVMFMALWVVANASTEGLNQAESKVCIVRSETRQKIDKSSSIATANIGFGGKAGLNVCVNTCSIHPECIQAVWDSHASKCYRNKALTDASSESQDGFTAMRCEVAPENKKTKICRVHRMMRHVAPSQGDQLASIGKVKYGGTAETEGDCLTPCASSALCMETTWSSKDKRCYPAKKAVVHDVTDGSGDFWTLQCVELTAEEIKHAGVDAQVQVQSANQTQVDVRQNQTSPEKARVETEEIDKALQKKQESRREAKQKEKAAEEKARAAAKLAEQQKLELKQEAAEKEKAKQEEKERRTKLQAAEEARRAQQSKEKKEKAAAAAKVAKEKDDKAKAQQAALVAEGKTKKEKKAKADEKLTKAEAKKELTQKALKVAKMAKEKHQKSDKWFGKGHLLFAQGIKYQGLLEKYSASHNKLDAYHYREELETYTDAFPGGFTSPLSHQDGELGKTVPAGSGSDVVRLLD